MKKKYLIFLGCFMFLNSFAQTDFKQVYDKALEYQIRSSVGISEKDFWKFHPGWYYSIFHSQYKSGNNEKNNYIQLDSILNSSAKSLLKVIQAREDIEIIYQNELAHWNDRNNDWELQNILKELQFIRDALNDVMSEFGANKVSLSHATKMYEELGRIDDSVQILGKAHLDNAKRRQGYERCQQEYIYLMNLCYKLCNYSLVNSKYDDYDYNKLISK